MLLDPRRIHFTDEDYADGCSTLKDRALEHLQIVFKTLIFTEIQDASVATLVSPRTVQQLTDAEGSTIKKAKLSRFERRREEKRAQRVALQGSLAKEDNVNGANADLLLEHELFTCV